MTWGSVANSSARSTEARDDVPTIHHFAYPALSYSCLYKIRESQLESKSGAAQWTSEPVLQHEPRRSPVARGKEDENNGKHTESIQQLPARVYVLTCMERTQTGNYVSFRAPHIGRGRRKQITATTTSLSPLLPNLSPFIFHLYLLFYICTRYLLGLPSFFIWFS